MEIEGRYKETHRTWNKIAQIYEDIFMDMELYNDTYIRFCELLSNLNASILEVGCGPGNITQSILKINSKLKILATDISVNMIELAKKNNPNIDVKILDCLNVNSLTDIYDGVVCGFTIPYLSKEDCTKFILDVSKRLNDSGVFYLSFVAGDYAKSGFISGSSGNRTYFYYHDLNSIIATLESNQLEIIDCIDLNYLKSDKTLEKHTIINAIKKT